jgi:hypothetical protein
MTIDGVLDWILHLLTIYTQLVNVSNYSTIVNIHNSQITTAPAKLFQACCVFTSRSLAAAFISGDSSASRSQVLSSQTPVQKRVNSLSLAYNISTRTTQKTAFLSMCSCMLLRERVYRAADQKRLWYMSPSRGRCVATALHALIFFWRNLRFSYSW